MRIHVTGLLIATLCGCASDREKATEFPPPAAAVDSGATVASTPPVEAVVSIPDSTALPAPAAAAPGTEWERADAEVVRVLPDSFAILPGVVKAEMNRRGCTVPQTYISTARHNVITGAFTAPGAVEWAVLCSVERVSQILVLDAATGSVVDSLNRSDDKNWLQGIGDGRIGFSRMLETMPTARLQDHITTSEGEPIPAPIDHDAILVLFTEKASTA